MSTNSSWDLDLLQGAEANRYCALVSFTILYLDYCSTLPGEVERFWERFTWSWASALFLVNRYLSILGAIPVLLEYFGDISEARCRRLQYFHQYYAFLAQATVGALLVIRTYALYGKDKRILALMLGTCILVGAVSIWSIITDKSASTTVITSHVPGCDLSLSDQQGRRLAFAWSLMLVIDTLIFILTVVKTARVNGVLKSSNLFNLMLRDGAFYYGIMMMTNIANIVTLVVVAPTAKGLWTTPTNVISSVLISRLMLRMRKPDRQGVLIGVRRCTTHPAIRRRDNTSRESIWVQ